MKNRLMLLISCCFLAFLLCATKASAQPYSVWSKFTFTAADLLNYEIFDGTDDTACVLGICDGARLLRVGSNADHDDAARSYWDSSNDLFEVRYDQYKQNGYVLDWVNLWGLDGRGANWCEEYKPIEWLKLTGPEGWEMGLLEWSWGAPPPGAHTNLYPYWEATEGFGIAMDDPDLASYVFTAEVKLDPEGWYDLDCGDNVYCESQSIWFGSWLTDRGSSWEIIDEHMFEGNIFLSQDLGNYSKVPEPGTWLLLGTGLLALLGFGRKKFFNKS